MANELTFGDVFPDPEADLGEDQSPVSPVYRQVAMSGVADVGMGYLGDDMQPSAHQWESVRARVLGVAQEGASLASEIGEPVLLVEPDICLADLRALRFEMNRPIEDLPVTLVPIYNKLIAALLKAIPGT
jgi:hypothetical protein